MISPGISQFIKCSDDIDSIASPLGLDSKSHIFIPVYDTTANCQVSGKHWSLLIYIKQFNVFYHFDSVTQLNLQSTKTIVKTVLKYIFEKLPFFESTQKWG